MNEPVRMFMAVNADGSPRFASSGYYLPLNKTADDARHGRGLGCLHANTTVGGLHDSAHRG